jgi:hypothetical protein
VNGVVIGKPLTWAWFLALVFAALSLQLGEELKAKTISLEYPKLYLRYEKTADTGIESSGLFLEAEGEREAFDVSMSSEPTAGKNHRRIGMRWEPPKGVTGEYAIRVRACFVQDEEAIPRNFKVSGGQIHEFVEQKKDCPNELEVTLPYRDVNGKKCPLRKFTISSSRDYRGDFEIAVFQLKARLGLRQ